MWRYKLFCSSLHPDFFALVVFCVSIAFHTDSGALCSILLICCALFFFLVFFSFLRFDCFLLNVGVVVVFHFLLLWFLQVVLKSSALLNYLSIFSEAGVIVYIMSFTILEVV